jgi:hypothetical protein
MAGNQGLSPNSDMSDKDREKVHKMGGEASGSRSQTTGKNDVITNNAGGGALDKAAQKKGGRSSHSGGNS